MSFAPKITQRRARHPSRSEDKTASSGKTRMGGKATVQSDDVESMVSSTPNTTRDSDASPLQTSNRWREPSFSKPRLPYRSLATVSQQFRVALPESCKDYKGLETPPPPPPLPPSFLSIWYWHTLKECLSLPWWVSLGNPIS